MDAVAFGGRGVVTLDGEFDTFPVGAIRRLTEAQRVVVVVVMVKSVAGCAFVFVGAVGVAVLVFAGLIVEVVIVYFLGVAVVEKSLPARRDWAFWH
jgi:hypothetical protein